MVKNELKNFGIYLSFDIFQTGKSSVGEFEIIL